MSQVMGVPSYGIPDAARTPGVWSCCVDTLRNFHMLSCCGVYAASSSTQLTQNLRYRQLHQRNKSLNFGLLAPRFREVLLRWWKLLVPQIWGFSSGPGLGLLGILTFSLLLRAFGLQLLKVCFLLLLHQHFEDNAFGDCRLGK